MELTGRKLGKYEVAELLGSGGMAEVYKGVDTRLERPVAIKVMHPHLAKSPDFQNRFLREAKATASLQHPNIVNLLDFDNEGDLYYMVMEFVEGGTLEDFLYANRPLDLNVAVDIIRQVAAGLEYAHGKSMVHRDIKPANVMFADGAKKRIVITDFGVTKLLDEEKITMTGAMLGTPQYMAPEVVKGLEADQRADIYSMGTMLFEMVTGQVPFTADTPYGVLLKQTSEPLPSPRDLTPNLPLDVETVLYKALEKEPDKRYQTAAAFDTALGDGPSSLIGPSFDNTIAQPSTFVQDVEQELESAEKLTSRKWLWIAGAFGVFVAIALIAGIVLSRGNEAPDIAENEPAETSVPVAVVEEKPTDDISAATDPTPLPEPTNPPPTDAPAEESPIVAAPEAPVAFDFASEAAFVCNIDYDLSESSVRVELDDLMQPPNGMEYVVWLANSGDGEFVNLGNVSPNQFLEGDVEASLDVISVEQFDQMILSVEPTGTFPQTPTEIVLEDKIEPAVFAIQNELLVSFVQPGLTQYQLAMQHSNLSADSLRTGDLFEARRHAEHVINILEGESGPNFGDLDRDGQTQNPGDGVGIFGYLLGARDLLTNADPIDPASPISFVQEGIDISIANSNAYADEAVIFALKMFAVDTAEEGLNVVDDLLFAVESAISGRDLDDSQSIDPFDNEGGLQTVEQLTAEWIEGSLFADHVLNIVEGQIGRMRYIELNGMPLSGVEIEIYPVPLVDDPDLGYFVYLSSDDDFDLISFGPFVPERFRLKVNLPADEIFLSKFNTVIISVEELSFAELTSSPNDPRYIAEIGIDELRSLIPILVGQDDGSSQLDRMAFEADLARQHVEFLIEALQANDLTLARRHAEHVINISLGEVSRQFGDADGNGTIENPSEDGFGVQSYNQLIRDELVLYIDNPNLNSRAGFYGDTVIPNSLRNQEDQITELVGLMFKILSADTVDEAGPFAETGNEVADGLLNGADTDGNGVIDVRESEGGILQLGALLHLLTERSFFDLSDE